MLRNIITKSITLPDGRVISIETGRLARQANSCVVVRMGNAMVMATVVIDQSSEESYDFLPLYVDYQEKFASAGKIPGGFTKREGRMSDEEILISRLVDRAIRPLMPDNFFVPVQINIFLISADEAVMPDTLAALAASAALCISPVPFGGPISEVRVGKIGGQLCINPEPKDIASSDIDIIVAANQDHIIMVEGEMNQVSEKDLLDAVEFSLKTISLQCQLQEELSKEIKIEKINYIHPDSKAIADIEEKLRPTIYDQIYSLLGHAYSKAEMKEKISSLLNTALKQSSTSEEFNEQLFIKAFKNIHKKALRAFVVENSVRIDGRKLEQIRPINIELDYLPSAHGSAIFTRGETQSLTTVTMGSKMDEKLIDSVMAQGYNKFMLHYNFPSFCTGEIKPNRGPGRREIGHGNLALRALKKVLPKADDNPYTIRIVSDILESNGSSSMATVCAGSLALMDTGVPIQGSVSGIAMGLIFEPQKEKYAILSDILGEEDHIGDMDFKVAGTRAGITACQMDIKIPGISHQMLSKALEQARLGRLHILDIMDEAISETRKEYKPHVPRIDSIRIPKDMIGALIGPSGKVIQEIQRETGTTIVIEETEKEGLVKVFASNLSGIRIATNKIKLITAKPEVGGVYKGKVKSILHFGSFVEFLPGKDGLLHISEIQDERIDDINDVLEVGQEVNVKLIGIDSKTGKYRLSIKATNHD
jgi:polyribonucleotide nucleotidyltransferase